MSPISAVPSSVRTARHILAIEISNPGAGVRTDEAGTRSGPSVALGRADGTRAELIDREWLRPTPTGTRGGIDDDLMPALERLFARVGSPARELLKAEGLVAVSVGPGGYTSLRIACAAGKMIAEAAGARAVSVPTDAALARAARATLGITTPLAVALAGKADSAWIRVHADRSAPTEPGHLLTAAAVPDLRDRGVTTLIADAHLPRDLRSAAESRGLRIVEPTYDAAVVMELGAELPAVDPVDLNPLYPREPDAVTLWRARSKP